MPTATEADAASRCVIERNTERSDFQPKEPIQAVPLRGSISLFRYGLDRKKLKQARRREGRYLLRCNLTDDDPA
ncbi:MAG TPA: hypothetical protein VK456_13235, partial [Xanthobacteraceae bacterium]|nr:hypothetical protein [Xanthobacteraceae bacterium]